MHWAKKLDAGMQKLNQVLIFISCIFLGILVIACILMVLTRFIPNFTLTGLEEIARYSFIYVTFLSLGAGVGSNAHPGLTFLRDALPQGPKKALDLFVYLAILVFGIIFIVYGYEAAMGVSNMISTSWRIPMQYIYFASVVGGFFTSINVINNMIQLILFNDNKRSNEIEEVQLVEAQMAEKAAKAEQQEKGGEV